MLRGAIRSGAAEETSATWKAWLLASKKVIAFQRHRIGRVAANDGVTAAPPAGVFELARGFAAGEGAVGFPVEVEYGVEDEAGRNGTLRMGLEGMANWKAVAGVVHSLVRRGVEVVKSAGLPTVLSLFCLLVLALQQRDVRRLTNQVEELVAAVGELRDRIDG